MSSYVQLRKAYSFLEESTGCNCPCYYGVQHSHIQPLCQTISAHRDRAISVQSLPGLRYRAEELEKLKEAKQRLQELRKKRPKAGCLGRFCLWPVLWKEGQQDRAGQSRTDTRWSPQEAPANLPRRQQRSKTTQLRWFGAPRTQSIRAVVHITAANSILNSDGCASTSYSATEATQACPPTR